jgi:phosphate starvation-inducible membrane PsiE
VEQDRGASPARRAVARSFGWVEDVVYVGLGVLLAVSAVALLVQGAMDLFRAIVSGVDASVAVSLLDRILLALMIVEVLYTVLVSFREHTLMPEPFLLVALIAAVRRILVITAEFGAQARPEETLFRHVMLELALLTVLIAVLVGSLAALRRRTAAA